MTISIACVGPWPDEVKNTMRSLLDTNKINVRKCSLLQETNSPIESPQTLCPPVWLLEKMPWAENAGYRDIPGLLLGPHFDEPVGVCYVSKGIKSPRPAFVYDFVQQFPKFGLKMIVVNVNQPGVMNNVMEVFRARNLL